MPEDGGAIAVFGLPEGADRVESSQAHKVEHAGVYLKDLSRQLLDRDDATGHLARLAEDPSDIEGALRFGCLLDLAHEPEGARWWWQFAAGAGNATAAYCLYLLHLNRGELRDAEHWIHQALTVGRIDFVPPPFWPQKPLRPDAELLQQAVGRLKAEEITGARFHHPDRRLAHQIGNVGDVR